MLRVWRFSTSAMDLGERGPPRLPKGVEALCFRCSLCSPPRRIDWLGNERCRVGALARTEFLEAPGVDLGDVEITFLVGGHAVHAPEGAGEIALRAPGIDQPPIELVF